MAKPLLIKTMKRILLGLIGVAVIGAMFWYVNTYIYKFYATSPTINVQSGTQTSVKVGENFRANLTFSNQNIKAIDAINLILTFDKDKLSFQNEIIVLPDGNYFKPTTGVVSDAGTNKSQLRLLLLANENVTPQKSLSVNILFKALQAGTATIKVEPTTEIGGIDATNNAVTYEENLDAATKQITIEAGTTGNIIAHWKMDDNVTGNNKTIDDFISSNDALTVAGANTTGVNCTVAGKMDKSCSFDGVDDYLKGTTNLTFGTKASITGWIKTTDTDGAIFGIVSPSYSNSLALRIAGGKVQGLTDYSSNWPNNSVTSAKTVTDNQWHYVAFVVEDTTGYIYIDGILDGKKEMASSSGFTDNSWAIGYSDASWAPAYYAGQIDDLKLYNVALTPDQIMVEAGITPTVSPSVGPSLSPVVSPSVSPSTTAPTATPLPTPPWVNTNYSTTSVFGIIQDVDENGEVISGKYWRKDASVCANATYSNSPQMNISGMYTDQCKSFNNIPYFFTIVQNPGTNIAYQLQNIPDGYECVGWEQRLRIKSDGKPFAKASGNGCTTGPLEITVNNAESSYENSHFMLFKIRKTVEPTPTSILEKYESVLNMRVKLQGIANAPREQYRKIKVNVTLKGGGQTVKQEQVEFTAQSDGTWTGGLGVDGINAATKYEVILKGAKHLAKRICANNPSEQLGGTYRCTDANMTLQKGANDLNFSGIILLGGDLPAQDGLINALDFAFIRQNLGNQDPQNLIRGDLNLDGIIDTQDHTIVKTALDFKYDEE